MSTPVFSRQFFVAFSVLAAMVGSLLVTLGVVTPLANASISGQLPFLLPYAVGESWSGNGPHQWDGKSGARNSVDLTGGTGHVRAVADGVVSSTSCAKPRIDHAGGWSTSYSHLVNIQVKPGQTVKAGQWIGDVGTATPCGGSASAKHVHLAFWRNGSPVSINGLSIGGWTILDGGSNYLGKWRRNADGWTYAVSSDGYMRCGCLKSYSVSSNPAGSFTSAISNSGGQVTVEGWAQDADSPNTQLRVDVYVSGGGYTNKFLGSTTANRSTSSHGSHGFKATFAHPVGVGWSAIKIVAVNVAGGSNSSWSRSLALSSKCGRIGTILKRADGNQSLVRYDCKRHWISNSDSLSRIRAIVPTYSASDAYFASFPAGDSAYVGRIDDPQVSGPTASIHPASHPSYGWANDYKWTYWYANPSPANVATWTYGTGTTGVYRVQVFIPGWDASAGVIYEVWDGSTKRCEKAVNQKAVDRKWVTLCDTSGSSSGKLTVRVADNRGAGPNNSKIAWDATQIIPIR